MKKLKVSREFKIGFFGIAMIALLYWGVNFLKGSDIFSSSTKYYAVYDQVNGLQPSSSIVIKGFKVGNISGMSYDPSVSKNVIVEFSIKSQYRIPSNSKARIFSDGFMGGKAVEIELGDSKEFLQAGDTLHSEINQDFLEVAGNEFEFLKQRANDLINEMMTTLQGLNAILVDNKGHLDATFSHIASITGNLDDVVASEKESMRQMLSNLNELTAALNAQSGRVDTLMGNMAQFSDSLRQTHLPTLVNQMTLTVNTLNATLEKINNGDGSAAMLLNDRQLYESLAASSANLSALLEDIRLHPKRYINISVFGGGRNRD